MQSYMEPTESEEAAELLGRVDALRGVRLSQNPFRDTNSPCWLTWRLGWQDERREMAEARTLREVQQRLRDGETIEQATNMNRRAPRKRPSSQGSRIDRAASPDRAAAKRRSARQRA